MLWVNISLAKTQGVLSVNFIIIFDGGLLCLTSLDLQIEDGGVFSQASYGRSTLIEKRSKFFR